MKRCKIILHLIGKEWNEFGNQEEILFFLPLISEKKAAFTENEMRFGRGRK